VLCWSPSENTQCNSNGHLTDNVMWHDDVIGRNFGQHFLCWSSERCGKIHPPPEKTVCCKYNATDIKSLQHNIHHIAPTHDANVNVYMCQILQQHLTVVQCITYFLSLVGIIWRTTTVTRSVSEPPDWSAKKVYFKDSCWRSTPFVVDTSVWTNMSWWQRTQRCWSQKKTSLQQI